MTFRSAVPSDERESQSDEGVTRCSDARASQVMEDIWLGSVLFREPPSVPVQYMQINSDGWIVMDGWGLRVSKTALLVHMRNKLLERFIAIHTWMNSSGAPAPRRDRSQERPPLGGTQAGE